ncbi:hypothetical protein NT6N_20720 [Oceaniferula spumae]|uniref:Carbohydrate-binding module family 96 domain-containing protein n=1 Tax=Oceaniferula spumae TaxID=2979115 RepID=A0AAT9FM48_9BACT
MMPLAEANHPNIPLEQDTDGDLQFDRVDPDDDDDGRPDNEDFAPLDENIQDPPLLTEVITAHADAGIRSNNSTSNYGSDAFIQMRGSNRKAYLAFQVNVPGVIEASRLSIYRLDEPDALPVFTLPQGNPAALWDEEEITWDNAPNGLLQDLSASIPAGAANSRSEVALPSMPPNPATVSYVLEESDDSGVQEIATREAGASQAPRLEVDYRPDPDLRLIVQYNTNVRPNINGSGPQISFQLSQAPTHPVYVPLALTDTDSAKLVDGSDAPVSLLIFDAGNWNTPVVLTLKGMNDGGSYQGPLPLTLQLLPLHSEDPAFSGNNPLDEDFEIDTLSLPTLVDQTIAVGSPWELDIAATPGVNDPDVVFEVVEGPVGLHITEGGGLLSMRPTTDQIGTHTVTIRYSDSNGGSITKTINLEIIAGGGNPSGLYVSPNTGSDTTGDGSAGNPYATIPAALVVATPGDSVFVRGGRYEMSLTRIENVAGTEANPILIRPLPGERVTFDFADSICFDFEDTADWIELREFEIDGGTDAIDHWEALARSWWDLDKELPGGGIAVHVDGTHITIKECVIHDCFQKGVNIEYARYVTVRNNVIYNIGHASLSGGHGIMRKWAEANFEDPGNPLYDPAETDETGSGTGYGLGGFRYRWDLHGNLIFGVEQRIYSWVNTKPQSVFILDEGKSVLIDLTTDQNMAARIAHNVLAYGAIDHIRLKPTPNLEVHHNAIYGNWAQELADGITEKGSVSGMPGMHLWRNAVMTGPGHYDYDLVQTYSPGTDYTTNNGAGTLYLADNVHAGGGENRDGLTGITDLGAATQLFVDADGGDFYPGPAMPANTGPSTNHLDKLYELVNDWGVRVRGTGWEHDHRRMVESILANKESHFPGNFINPVFGPTQYSGEEDHFSIYFEVVDNDWHGSSSDAYGTFQIILHKEYSDWFLAANPSFHPDNHDYGGGGAAKRRAIDDTTVTWGSRTLAVDFTPTASQTQWMNIGGTTVHKQYHQIEVLSGNDAFGDPLTATLGGTLEVSLVDSFVPQIGDRFVLVKAPSINGSFATTNLPTLPAGRTWLVEQTSTEYALVVTTDGSLLIDDWRTVAGLAADGSEDWIDANGDGFPNVFSFVFNLDNHDDPSVALIDRNPLGVVAADPTPAAGAPDGTWTFTYTRLIDPTGNGLAIVEQLSTDLSQWDPVTDLTEGVDYERNVTGIDADYEQVALTFPIMPQRQFIRLQVNTIP